MGMVSRWWRWRWWGRPMSCSRCSRPGVAHPCASRCAASARSRPLRSRRRWCWRWPHRWTRTLSSARCWSASSSVTRVTPVSPHRSTCLSASWSGCRPGCCRSPGSTIRNCPGTGSSAWSGSSSAWRICWWLRACSPSPAPYCCWRPC